MPVVCRRCGGSGGRTRRDWYQYNPCFRSLSLPSTEKFDEKQQSVVRLRGEEGVVEAEKGALRT